MDNKILTTNEACILTGLSKSWLYRLTMNGNIPCYRPTGRKLFFDEQELKEWMHSNRKEAAK